VNFERKAYRYLLDWKERSDRRPLIIRGARQVGKSTLVEDFSREYKHFISLNLEKAQARRIFEDLENTKDIVEAIFLQSGTPYNSELTLIFIDEIQESPKAIQQLRYLYEDFPHLHVIAAGSLLEFALRKVASFPVGRVDQMLLHPFDFEEYLMALNRKDLLRELENIPVNKFAHTILLDLFHQYAISGGMPEIVRCYVSDNSLANLGQIYNHIWQSYRDDVEKYASNTTERKVIRHIIDTAASEKDRITLAGFGHSNYRSREVGEAIRALDLARIIQLVYPTVSLQPPVIPDIKRKPRLQFLDTGLLNFTLGIQAEMIGIKDLNNFYQGKIIQHLVAQQLQAQMSSLLYKPLFWVREEANSTSEVDLVYQYNQYVIPIEIKSGEQGRLRSLHQFVQRTNHRCGIRMLANNFSIENVKTPDGTSYQLMNMPYYLATRIPQYIEWFINRQMS